MTRKPRVDAEQNRRHILTVARAAFAADGLDLPVREIARRAGLGPATLYRHFPARPELIHAVLVEQVEACGEEMREALSDPDPGRALRTTLLRFAERQVHDRGLNEALLGSHVAGRAFADERREHSRALETLVDRARSAGVLHPGVTVADVRVGLLAIASWRGVALPRDRGEQGLDRLTRLLLTGLGELGEGDRGDRVAAASDADRRTAPR